MSSQVHVALSCSIALFSVGIGASAQVQDPVAAERRKLIEIVQRTTSMSSDAILQTIQSNIDSSSPELRERALNAMSSRTFGAKTSEIDPVLLGGFESMRETLFRKLQDPESKVRHAAVLAIQNLDMVQFQEMRFRPQTTRLLLSHYYQDTSDRVRAEIVKGLALVKNNEGDISILMDAAMLDQSARVRFFAIRGISRLVPHYSFEKVWAALLDKDVGVRVGAAMALSNYKDKGRERLSQLIQIAANEPDPQVKRALEFAISRLKAGLQ